MRKVLHFAEKVTGKDYYRRARLKKFLEQKYSSEEYIFVEIHAEANALSLLEYLKDAVVLLSRPSFSPFFLEFIKKHNCSIIYDRTDRWNYSGLPTRDFDVPTMKIADAVICSAKVLYEDAISLNKSSFFIPNGCETHEFIPSKKYSKKTAVYIGQVGKIYLDVLHKIAIANPDWSIKLIGLKEIEKFPLKDSNIELCEFMNPELIYDELKKCHVGLVPFVKSKYTDGQLPLKLLQYLDAHLPVLQSNCPASKDYENVYDVNDTVCLDDLLKKDFKPIKQDISWETAFKKIKSIIDSYR